MGVTYIHALWQKLVDRVRRRHIDWYVWVNGEPRPLDEEDTPR